MAKLSKKTGSESPIQRKRAKKAAVARIAAKTRRLKISRQG